MNKILVYGATGDQGLPLIDELLKHGYKVRAASRNPDDFISDIIKGKKKNIRGNGPYKKI